MASLTLTINTINIDGKDEKGHKGAGALSSLSFPSFPLLFFFFFSLYLLSHSVIYTAVIVFSFITLSNLWGSREDCIGAALCSDEHEGVHDVLAVEVGMNAARVAGPSREFLGEVDDRGMTATSRKEDDGL